MGPDRKALEVIDEEGIDLSRPYNLSHWMYFDDRAAAERLAALLRSDGLRTDITGSKGDSWLLLAHHRVVVTDDLLDGMRAQLTELAARFGGTYDGWEMEVPVTRH